MKPLFFTLLLLTAEVYASQDMPVDWRSVSIGLGPDPAKHSVRAVATDGQLTGLTLHTDKGAFKVPREEFASVSQVHLDSIRILRGQAYGKTNNDAAWFIEFRYGTPSFDEYPRAKFVFHSGAYQRLTLTVRTSENTWQDTNK